MKVQLNKAIIAIMKPSRKKILNCEFCDYTYMKNITFKQHMANNHQNNRGDDDYGCPSEDEIFNLSEIKEQKAKKDNTKKSFVFSESMLDEFDPWIK